MTAKIEFFPVDNGDMTLLTLENGKTILIDINIRKGADDENDEEKTDVAALLRDRLARDSTDRLYVDVFLLTHPDEDHCRGLDRHFHLGAPEGWSKKDDKIFIREMWSSPIVFRRKKDVEGALCADAQAWWDEARRRVNYYKALSSKASVEDGNRIQILGEDKDGKTDQLTDILVKTNSRITKVCGKTDDAFSAWLLAPQLVSDEEAEKLSGKNHSSTVVRFNIKADGNSDAGLFLAGGDAEVENWERIWDRNSKLTDRLTYNLLLAPHHCSWHSLSYDGWKEHGNDAKVSDKARNALSQAQAGAFIVSSSKEILDDNDDPPCIRAKREYEAILKTPKGSFLCVFDECDDDVLLFEFDAKGPHKGGCGSGGDKSASGSGRVRAETEKKGGGRYA